MAVQTTTPWDLPYPDENEPWARGNERIQALAEALKSKLTPATIGPLASRPVSTVLSPSNLRRFYFAEDVGIIYFDYGYGWLRVSAPITDQQIEALAGTHGTPSDSNRYVTEDDPLFLALQNSLVTALPSSPVDGQTISYLADPAKGIIWRFRYRAYEADGVTPNLSDYKWESFGGNEAIYSQVRTASKADSVGGADDATAQGTFRVPSTGTAGPSITVPLAGEYRWKLGYKISVPTTTSSGTDAYWSSMGFRRGLSPVQVDDTISAAAPGQGLGGTALGSGFGEDESTFATAGQVLTCRYATTTGQQVSRRKIALAPIRVG